MTEAWCARCDGPSQVDDRGCVTCAGFRVKHRNTAYQADWMRYRRIELISKGKCINGAKHPAPEPGKRKCTRCLEQHRRSNKR